MPAQAESWKPEEVLSWAFSTYGKDVAIASGFGVEGMVLLDLASRVRPDFRVFTLDTEFLFPETYDLMDRVEKRYGIKVEKSLQRADSRRAGARIRRGALEPRSRPVLRLAQGRTAQDEADGTARLDHRHPPRPDFLARLRPQGGVGCQVSAAEDQSHRRLDFARWSGAMRSSTTFLTTRCTTRTIPASDAPTAPGPSVRERVHAQDAGLDLTRPNADCTLRPRSDRAAGRDQSQDSSFGCEES